MASEQDSSNLAVEELRRLVQNCRHGGPTEQEQGLPYFMATNMFVSNAYTPLDPCVLNSSSSVEEICSAIQQTVQLIISNAVLNRMRTSPGAARYLGALALDAWFANDPPNVKTFLIKGIFMDALLLLGPEALLKQDIQEETRKLALRFQLILRDCDVRKELKRLTRGACHCVSLSETLQEINEQNSPAAMAVQSSYWKLKNRAAAELKLNRLQASIKLYTQAHTLIKEQLCLDPVKRGVGSWTEGRQKLSSELGRIESNLSFIYAGKLKDYKKALEHANNAVGNFPSWSKAHCRRAVALEGLGCLFDAEAAISKALEILKDEEGCMEEESSAMISKTRTEYQEILCRIEKVLQENNNPINDLQDVGIRNLKISTDYAQAGTFTGCWEAGVQVRVAVFLSPRDVASLEQTCRGFAAQPEQMRRYALSGPLWSLCPKHKKMEKLIEGYCSETLKEPLEALRVLMAAVLAMVPHPTGRRVPSWLDRLLSHASVDSRNIIQALCIANHDSWRGPLSLWAFENACVECHDLLSGNEGEDGIMPVFKKDDDGQMLRIIAWLSPLLGKDNDDNVNSYPQLRELREKVFVIMNNVISRGVDCRVTLTQVGESSPVMAATMALTSVFSENFPGEWPCEKPLEMDWNYSVPEITRYFCDKPLRVHRRWITALRKLAEWAETVKQHSEEFVLCSFIVLLDYFQENGRIQISAFSAGLFAVKKSIQIGGNARLDVVSDVVEWMGDFYSWIRLYDVSLPNVIDWRDRSVAQHNMMMGRHRRR